MADAGIPVLNRRDGGPEGVRIFSSGICRLSVSGLMAELTAGVEEGVAPDT
jgi:hypothetical protein